MKKPTLRGVLLGSLLAVGLVLVLVGGAIGHLGYRRVLERMESGRAKSLAAAAVSIGESASDETERVRLFRALASDGDAVGLALLGGDPVRVLAGTQAAWAGQEALALAELDATGRLQEWLLAPREAPIRDRSFDRHVYVYPAGSSGHRILGETPRFTLVQLDSSVLQRELWTRSASRGVFALGLLAALALVTLRVVQRHTVNPLIAIGSAVARRASGGDGAREPLEFATQEFSEFGRMFDEMVRDQNLAHNDLQRSEAELRLLGRVTRIADRVEDLDDVLRECCAQICRFLCWPIAHIYLVDENDRSLLQSSGIWHLSSPELAQGFVEETTVLSFREGEGLPGRVLECKEPVWVGDCWEEDWFTRSRPDDGVVRAAVGFPIFLARDVIAVLELFDLRPRERESSRTALMHNIGLTLGQVLQRRQQHELLVRRNRELVEAMQNAVSATQAKSAFLANMSHEMRTPLTAIVGYAELLPGAKGEKEAQEYTDAIMRNGRLLLQLINDILDVSKVEAGRLEVEHIECFPAEILQSVVRLLEPQAREKGLELNVSYDGRVPARVVTDPTRLHQVLVNLISNAIKFTQRGYVKVTAGLKTPTESNRPRLGFAVEDSGNGMSQEDLEVMFRPFAQADMSTTRRFGGTGLGLSISRSLVELLGGELRATSEEGRGSRFSFTIETDPLQGVELLDHPIVPRPGVEPRSVGPEGTPLEGIRILLAEDGADNQRLITRILSAAGAKVEVVENGALASERALAAASAGEPFDVILMDMQMPVLDGYAATRGLRQQGYRGRIVAVTANAMKGDREKCLTAGCDDFVSKPLNRSRLISVAIEDPEAA